MQFANELMHKMDSDPNYALSGEDAEKFNGLTDKFSAWIENKEKEIDLLKAP